jgi:anti-sigma regulatory factor (Ser/Thr protein kinase)
MTEGFSTANEWIRSLGFGAGMGLPNARRVSDDFHIESGPGRGTQVRVLIKY